MNTTKLNCSVNNTAELRNLILENPELPLLVFCGEGAWSGEYGYEQADVSHAAVKELALYGDFWLDKDDYEDRLADDLCDQEEYQNLSDEEYAQMIKKKTAEIEFVKAIVVYVG